MNIDKFKEIVLPILEEYAVNLYYGNKVEESEELDEAIEFLLNLGNHHRG